MQSVHQFAEKVALVTDGANPIGRAVALQLALQGSYVITAYSNLEQGERNYIDELKALGTLAGAVEAQVFAREGAESVINEIDRTFGRLDLLINCLKFGNESLFRESTGVEPNIAELDAASFVTQAAMRLIQPRPKPKVVNVGWSENSVFVDFTGKQAAEMPDKFRVNCVVVREGRERREPVQFEFCGRRRRFRLMISQGS